MSLNNAFDVVTRGNQNPVVTEVLCALTEELTDTFYPDIRDLCLNAKDYEGVATSVVAVAAFTPVMVEHWMKVVTQPLRETEMVPNDTSFSKAFGFGVVLGIFETGVWLDQHRKEGTGFEEIWALMVEKIILNHSLRFWGDTSSDDAPPLPSRKYETRLSEAIKKFIRGEKVISQWRKGRNQEQRIVWTSKLFEAVTAAIDAAELKDDMVVSPIGQLLLGQLEYAVFGSLTVYGRAEALRTLPKEATQEA